MLLEPRVGKASMLYYMGEPHDRETRKISLLDAFQDIRHLLEFGPSRIDAVLADSIVATRCATLHSHVSFCVGGKRVRAEKEVMTFQADPQTMAAIIEYLHRRFNDRPDNPVPEALRGLPGGKPSWLPSLILSEHVLSLISPLERAMLADYGIGKELSFQLVTLRPDGVRWLDIVAANALWFENPEMAFVDILRGMIPGIR